MALKFGTTSFLTQRATDHWSTLIKNYGRDVIEFAGQWVGRAAGRSGAGCSKWRQVEPVFKSSASVAAPRRSSATLKHVYSGLVSRCQPQPGTGLVARFSRRITQQQNRGTEFRWAIQQFGSVGRKLAMYSFVGVGFAGSQMSNYNFHETCNDVRQLFGSSLYRDEKKTCDLYSFGLDEVEIGNVIVQNHRGFIMEAVLTRQVNPVADVEEDNTVEDTTGHDEEMPSFEVIPDEHFDMIRDNDADLSLIENEINMAVETSTQLQDEVSQIVRQLTLSHRLQSAAISQHDGDESSSSIEVLEVSDLEMLEEEEEDEEEDDEMLLDELKLLIMEHGRVQRELQQLTTTLNRQNVQIQHFLSTQREKVRFKVLWMPNSSQLYVNHILSKELLTCQHQTENTKVKCKMKAHFNIEPVVGGCLATVERVHDVTHLGHISEEVTGNRNDLAVCVFNKTHEFTLREFLSSHDVGIFTSELLLAQLLEAVVHLGEMNVCHRNLTSADIHINMANDVPHLLVANFGSSLQIGSRFGFRVATFEDELFGSHFTRLTAPEIVSARQSSYLNYVKSDLWTCGTLAYEIFGSENPFSSASRNGRILTSSSYTDSDLPDLNDRVPSFIQRLVKLMLKNDPSKRPDAVELADALHVILWAPPAWYSTSSSTAVTSDLPSSVEVARWLTMFAATTFCHRPRHRAAGVPRGRSPGGASPVGTATVTEQWSPGRSSPVGTATVTEQLEEEHLLSPVITALKTQFLSRVNIESIFNALRLIRRAETTFDRC